MITYYYHQTGFLGRAPTDNEQARHKASVVIEGYRITKNRYGLANVTISYRTLARLYSLTPKEIERYFAELK